MRRVLANTAGGELYAKRQVMMSRRDHDRGFELGRGRGGSHCMTCPIERDRAY